MNIPEKYLSTLCSAICNTRFSIFTLAAETYKQILNEVLPDEPKHMNKKFKHRHLVIIGLKERYLLMGLVLVQIVETQNQE